MTHLFELSGVHPPLRVEHPDSTHATITPTGFDMGRMCHNMAQHLSIALTVAIPSACNAFDKAEHEMTGALRALDEDWAAVCWWCDTSHSAAYARQSETNGQGATTKHAQVARARSLLPDKVHVLEVPYETPYIRDTSPLVSALL